MNDDIIFEHAMRLILGDAAHHIAGEVSGLKGRKRWLRKAIKRLIVTANALDTSPRHKECLMAELSTLDTLVKKMKEPDWFIVDSFLRLTARLLGYDFLDGAAINTPVYSQTPNQHYTQVVKEGGDVMQDYHDKNNAILIRRRIVQQLTEEGCSTFTTALVLNTSEHQVKTLRIKH